MKKRSDEKNKKNRSFESNPDPLSPGDKRIGNSPKRTKTEKKCIDPISDPIRSSNEMEVTNLENVASQITIEGSFSPTLPNKGASNRLDFINVQKKNTYSSSNHLPYLVHIEIIDNIGDVHRMRLSKAFAEHFPAIQSIKRLSKNIITINYKFSSTPINLSSQLTSFQQIG